MDFIVFYERLCQQFPDRDKDGQQILPNKISMKRRLADFYQQNNNANTANKRRNSTTTPNTSTTNSTYLWAMDKFRDCVPNLVMVIQKGAWTSGGREGERECVILEPGKIGPLPMEHPTVRSLTSAVDAKRMTAELMTVMRAYNVPFYDGGALIGIVDYRKSSNKSPNVLKVWLRPSYTSVILAMRQESTMSIEMERKLLETLNPELHLDMDPPSFLGDVLTLQRRNQSQVLPKFFANALMSKGESGFDRESTQGAIPIGKLRRMAALEECRSKEQETVPSADQVLRMPSSLITNQSNSLPAACFLWRTVQWEKRAEDRPSQFWGLNVYVQPLPLNNNLMIMRMPQLEFLVVLWQGTGRPDLMQKTERTTFKTVQMVEQFLAQAKKLMHLEDCGRRIFNEAINPSALRANFYNTNSNQSTIASPMTQKSSSNTTTGKQNMPKLDSSNSSGNSGSSTPTKKQPQSRKSK